MLKTAEPSIKMIAQFHARIGGCWPSLLTHEEGMSEEGGCFYIMQQYWCSSAVEVLSSKPFCGLSGEEKKPPLATAAAAAVAVAVAVAVAEVPLPLFDGEREAWEREGEGEGRGLI